MIAGHTVIVLRYSTDRYGDRTQVDEFTVPHCAFAPRTSASGRDTAELGDRSGAVTVDAELYAPYGVDIHPEDVVLLSDGTDWEVVGRPERWEGAFPGSWPAGTVVPLQRKTG